MKSTACNRSVATLLVCAAVLALGGCSMTMTFMPPAAVKEPVATAAPVAKPLYLPANTIEAANAPRARAVNAFGEMTDSHGGAALLVADVSLRRHTNPANGYDADVSLTPDGRFILFSGSRDGGPTRLFRQSVTGGAAIPLTPGEADDAQPAVSPDGKTIAFCSNRSGSWHLYAMDADGGEARQLTDGDADDLHPSFSPDGKKIAYCTKVTGEADAWKIAVLDLATRSAQPLTPGLFPAWSPRKDGDVIVYQKARAHGSRWFSLWTCEVTTTEGGGLQAGKPTEIATSADAALVNPAWSTDGAHVVYTSMTDPKAGRAGKPDVWVADVDGANKARLTHGGANFAPVCGVDKRVYFVSDRTGRECIWSVPVNGRLQAGDPASAAVDPSEVRP